MSDGGRVRRSTAGLRLALVLGAVITLISLSGVVVDELSYAGVGSPAAAPLRAPAGLQHIAGAPGEPGPGGDPSRRILVLYHAEASDPELSHSYAVQAANLASRGGTWTMEPIERYQRGRVRDVDCVIYIGMPAPNPVPAGFVSDVVELGVPTLWLGDNFDQLNTLNSAASTRYGWTTVEGENVAASTVTYKGQKLVRRAGGIDPLQQVTLLPSGPATVLAKAAGDDGAETPWAVTAGNLTYIAEVPFSYVDVKDRYLAAADIILGLVAPDAPERKRALIRIEDVGPNTDPQHIRRIADSLSEREVPFSMATYPYFRDPKGTTNRGRPAFFRLIDRPELVDALQYATERGGTIIMHGYTHQYESLDNPYDGKSGADYEFYLAHVDEDNSVQLDGPVPDDSSEWAADRLAVGRAEFVRAGLPDPDIFEFPHYTASAASYQAVNDVFGVRYDHGTYFAGQCPDGACALDREIGSNGLFQQYFPYPVRDVYGSVVIPENLRNISFAYNNNAARSAQDVLDAATAMTVVKDGVASAFFHPFLPVEDLLAVVDGIEARGFQFVTPYDILERNS